MFALFVSLALLGLSAIDPVGIAAMPILLTQKNPLARSFTFLGGSFVSLMLMGLLFARGFGTVVLDFENTHSWFISSVEYIAGLTLLAIAGTIFWRARAGVSSVEPSKKTVRRLQLGGWRLFWLGALLVCIQSVIDVVFVIAMIRIGQLKLSIATLAAAVATYAIAALVLQFAVIAAYLLTPKGQRTRTLGKIHKMLVKYADKALIGVSLLLGVALIIIAA